MGIHEEIKEAAEKLNEVFEKAQKSVAQDNLIKAIFILGAEGVEERLSSLEKGEKLILLNTLEEIKKGTSMDANYAAKYVQGDVYGGGKGSTIIQEDKADDDADEKLVRPENAKVNHQGDQGEPSREENKVEDPKKDMKKGCASSTDMHDQVGKGHEEDKDDMKKAVSEMVEKGMNRDQAEGYGMAKGYSGNAYTDAMSEKYGEKEMKKGAGEIKNPEEGQVNDDLEKLKAKKARGDKTRPEALKVENENKAAQAKVDDLKQKEPMKKSVVWGEANALLKSNTLGRNHHFSINDHYDEAIQLVMDYKPSQPLKKAEDVSINGMIESGSDASRDEVLVKAEFKRQNKEKVTLTKSFSLDDLAHELRISKGAQEEILNS